MHLDLCARVEQHCNENDARAHFLYGTKTLAFAKETTQRGAQEAYLRQAARHLCFLAQRRLPGHALSNGPNIERP